LRTLYVLLIMRNRIVEEQDLQFRERDTLWLCKIVKFVEGFGRKRRASSGCETLGLAISLAEDAHERRKEYLRPFPIKLDI